ncbi:nitrilase/cyanide hydratase and apolipoprotein N-acyltransferase [Candidatus Nitrosoglobus terrae]|uniref:Nitrilase/cyanide hydratase and apolipoprotein N-acyltransferase n=1 Tax=Candidatus Nitrosoglobus terrae TaxID=1630141 RepID=A0A1Q2SNY7_9GAMM|nr:carbon-nitrogen hydrolase [Candidatus Nitrosoglobus terrae]BAW80846.1 nitrilase/cyanide hydratase and apolipoprotein N-acyltransferase [Candidatus Nitrosoglobus terrae]
MKVAIVQQICSQQQQENLNHSIQGIREAASQGAKLILLPELHIARYFCQVEDTRYFALAEPIPGPSTAIFSALAVELKVVLVISLFERRTAGIYHNTAVVLDTDGRIAGRYRKMHIPDDPGFYEKFYFTPGDLGFTPINTSIGCLGVLVCWDQWYPEAARLMALAGAELLLYPSAIGWNPEDDAAEKYRQREAWITIQRAHAIANGLPLLSSNRVGIEANPNQHIPGIQFWGTSFIAGPQGELLTIGSTDEPIVLVTEIDLQRTEKIRQIWPYFRDRRIDSYGKLSQRYLD